MWVPVVGLPPRLMLSALGGAGRFCLLGSGTATLKDLRLGNRRGLSESCPQELPYPDFNESPSVVYKYRGEPKRYVSNRKLAETVAHILQGKRRAQQLLLECNPGPGILTQALLETGATVVALESDKTFIPHLETLGNNLDGQLDVIHCDFFKMDPRNSTQVKPPILLSHILFQNLGIKARPWSAGVPLKVIGIFPIRSERKVLWKLLYDLYSCTSIYKYGRIELNMFIGEKEYQRLVATPSNSNLYQAWSVLWQVACEIKLLHTEPWSSFDMYNRNGELRKPKRKESLDQQNLYFIQMTPRKNLFTENLTPVNYDVFFHMLKHCFGKRSARLIDHLHSLTPVDARHILKKICRDEKVKVTNIYPEDFKRIFEAIECSKDHAYKWLYDDSMVDAKYVEN
ncbi:dimethyladenosine transferase 2, mitochondrial [Nycticebus coucang]|uniref:dimethyladenosine transferase 2, mitochondrial n=1 Tax=Nycticebus coucang TaxID=9470 RepID=UPI00234C80D2|nr:dimethyladenosine transferase 2, mitochondrial [Nycticebus coucang]